MTDKEFAIAVKEQLEKKLNRIVTPKQMEYMWNELKVKFIDDVVHYQDESFKLSTSRNRGGVDIINYHFTTLYNWCDLIAGSPEPVRLPVKIDLNTMLC